MAKHVSIIKFISLSQPKARVLFFGSATVVIFFLPFDILHNFSIWARLGIPSPSIGLTRAYWLLMHGRPTEAWQMNKLIFLVVLIILSIVISDAIKIHRANQH